MMLLLLLALIAAAAVEVATAPYGRHRGAHRLVPVETERRAFPRHRRGAAAPEGSETGAA
ncbi:hypothetical protein [Kitasatospora sp. NPDC004289]